MIKQGASAETIPSDGRNRRRANNRAAIIASFLGLVREGVMMPSAQAVAERAKVSPRTVFRCFQDMESLYREIVVALREEFLPRAYLDLNTTDRRERLSLLLANRASVFEDMTPFRLAAEAHRQHSPAISGDKDFLVAMERDRLVTVINPDGALDSLRLEGLSAVTCFEFWRRLRHEQGLDQTRAAEVMRAAAMAILDSGPDVGPVNEPAKTMQ